MPIFEWISGRVFKYVHGNNLVYNCCWEDPRLDHVALELTPQDNVLVITSAGCNALDYAIKGPNHVHAVDMNPRQNALLDLKMAGIRKLDFDDFFQMFGSGTHSKARTLYQERLRAQLPAWSQTYWDKYISFYTNPTRPFFFRGTSGYFARWIKFYTERVIGVSQHLDQALEAKSIAEQQEIYDKYLKPKFWSRSIKFAMGRDTTLSLLGVPKAQRKQIDTQYPGGVVQFIRDCVEAVFTKLPLSDNYFWRAYIKGCYTRNCCPEYLREENFLKLKGGLVDRVSTHTNSVQGFLEGHQGTISRYILLDHMDWLSDKFFPLLELEWQAIADKAAPNTRILWRSGGLRTDFLNDVSLTYQGKVCKLPELLTYHTQLAAELHEKDRVHTYGSFYIADFAKR